MALTVENNDSPVVGGRTRHIVDVGDVKIDVIAEGKGPLIVLIPSLGRSGEEFDELAVGFAKEGFRVLRPQPRGMDGSVGPMSGVSYHDFAKDIAGVIEQDGGGPAIVAGHAFGNWVARTIAADYPDLVKGVVLVAGGSKTWPQELSDAITTINDFNQPRAARLKALELAFFARGHDASSWLEGWHPDVTKCQRDARAKSDISSWWGAGKAPILDLQAADDPFRPRATMNDLKNEFGSRVTVAVIPNASHALPVEQPDAVLRAIIAWAGGL